MMQSPISELIKQEGLPDSFALQVDKFYRPLASALAEHAKSGNYILGVQGSQGSGKSTLALFLKFLLEHEHGLRCAALSLDDVYLKKAEREQLARQLHPLFKTRGVPGTHDVELACNSLDQLINLKSGQTLALPRFDKASDDRKAATQWDSVSGPIDIVIFEGWCVGVEAQTEQQLQTALNELETQEDTDGRWRHAVNQALAGPYKKLFSKLDKLVVLQAPSFECVYEWRALQEEKLRKKLCDSGQSTEQLLDKKALRHFINHYERLTRHCLVSLPGKADWVLQLDANHRVQTLSTNNYE
ncbi:phosphoribulokinase [Agaribacterium haliotis]|uniref:phosphoribulokinase n=1 Tax=Agaribacterium haliotis TaxID=2013869 RepID=UPI000BB57BD2|nr:phosphoribulokinase [Agaribacterium haliotis]